VASVKLIAIAKDEGAYLAEWIYHHLRLGIQEIDVYLNGITDNSFELMRCICSKHKNVNFYHADVLMGISLRAKRSFQHTVYRYAWETEKKAKRFSHIAFLDIDEYFVARNFKDDINDFISTVEDFDILSNLWYSDLPTNEAPFSRFFVPSLKLQKMSVLKSIGRLNSKLGNPMIHNFTRVARKPEGLVSILSDGSKIQYSGRGKRLSRQDSFRCQGTVEPWFVFHRIFRSHDEYCASLMRGRRHRSNDAPIKDNRFGYIPTTKSFRKIGDSFEFTIEKKRCIQYQRGFDRFVDQCNLYDEIEAGQKFIREKYKALEELLDKHPEILKHYSQVFKGTIFAA